jgi:hypothetical protein
MAEQQAQLPAVKRRGTKQYVVLALVVVLLLAVAAAVSYYGDEIRLYLSVGGWNRGIAVRITRQFVDDLQAGRRKEALALVDAESYEPYSEEGKSVGLEHKDVSGRGRYRIGFEELIPPGKVTIGSPTLTGVDRGGLVVPVQFADGTQGWFVISRVEGAYRITSLPMVPGRFHY